MALFVYCSKQTLTMRLACFILLSAVIALQSCKDEDPAPFSFPETGSGILNYSYEGKQNIRLKSIQSQYFVETIGGYSNFYIRTKNNYQLSDTDTNFLSISLYNISKPGVYPVGNVRIVKPIAGKDVWVYFGYSGTVDITKLDTVNHIWSGRFNVNLSIQKIANQESWEPKPIHLKDTISITNGWFDLPLSAFIL